MRKILMALFVVLKAGSAMASIETPLLVCQTEDKNSYVQLTLFQEKNQQYEVQIAALTSSPITAGMQYWSNGKVTKQVAMQLKTALAKPTISEKDLPILFNAYATKRATAYNVTKDSHGQTAVIVAGYYGETMDKYVQLINCVIPKK